MLTAEAAIWDYQKFKITNGGKTMKRPVIGITAFDDDRHYLYAQRTTYSDAVWNNGGMCIFLPCRESLEDLEQTVALCDGLIIPGGGDLDPSLYGEQKMEECGSTNLINDIYDIALIREAVRQQKPILAICRGMQAVNVAYGGTLYQDIPSQYETDVVHRWNPNGMENYHTANIEEDSFLFRLFNTAEIKVNTSHHQAVKDVAEGFAVTARCQDGIIEAIECLEKNIIAVQWHPERMQDEELFRQLFHDFIQRCQK